MGAGLEAGRTKTLAVYCRVEKTRFDFQRERPLLPGNIAHARHDCFRLRRIGPVYKRASGDVGQDLTHDFAKEEQCPGLRGALVCGLRQVNASGTPAEAAFQGGPFVRLQEMAGAMVADELIPFNCLICHRSPCHIAGTSGLETLARTALKLRRLPPSSDEAALCYRRHLSIIPY